MNNLRIKIFFIILLFFFFAAKVGVADAIMIAPGIYIKTDTTWTKANSPYIVDGFWNAVYINSGATLTIEPGTIVKFEPSGYISLSGGNLIASGTPEEPIVFTSIHDDGFGGDNDGVVVAPQAGDWSSIFVNPSAKAVLKNAKIMYGGDFYGGKGGAISVVGGDAWVSNSEIMNNVYGLEKKYGAAVLHENKIFQNEYGVFNSNSTAVDATNNWWGADSGPFKAVLNASGQGDKIYGNVSFDPWIGKKAGNSNILFLPGLEASRLYRQGDWLENQLWEPNRNADVEKLFMDTDGKSLDSGIYTRDVIDEANLTLIGRKNIYLSFKEDLANWKDKEKIINDYAIAPYDWRYSLEDILSSGINNDGNISYNQTTDDPFIIKELKRLAASSRSGKVTIIAHSNGGLLTKALINKLGPEAEKLIDKIVFVAVPQVGTPQAIGGILHGYDQGLPTDFFSFFLSPSIARRLAVNMPSAYHLLPSKKYFDSVATPVIKFGSGAITDYFAALYGQEINNFEKLSAFLRDTYGKVSPDDYDLSQPIIANQALLTYANNIHTTIDNQVIPVSIEVHQIAGWGEDTLSGIEYWTGQECRITLSSGKCLAFRDKMQYSPEISIDGDGTVMVPSALAMSESGNVKRWWVDLDDYDKWNVYEREHADILEVGQLRDFIKNNLLTKTTDNLPSYIYNSQPTSDVSGKKLQYILHSPLDLSIRDNNGNLVNSATSTIPDGRFKRFGEVQYISVPVNTPHTLELDGTGTGSFTLEMREAVNEQIIATTTFAAIPCATGMRVTMVVPDGGIQNAQDLKIDYDNDGLVDYSLKPRLGETVMAPSDHTSPEAKIYFDPENGQLKIEGVDESPTTVTYIRKTSKIRKPENLVTAIVTDEAGNQTVISYTEKLNKGNKLKIDVKTISQGGGVTTTVEAEIAYKWKKEKNKLKMMAAKIETGDSKTETHYRPKRNVTIVMTKPEDLDDRDDDDDCERRATMDILSGLVIPGIQTNQGKINIYY